MPLLLVSCEKVLSCANVIKPIPHIIFYQIQGRWSYSEILDTFGVEIYIDW